MSVYGYVWVCVFTVHCCNRPVSTRLYGESPSLDTLCIRLECIPRLSEAYKYLSTSPGVLIWSPTHRGLKEWVYKREEGGGRGRVHRLRTFIFPGLAGHRHRCLNCKTRSILGQNQVATRYNLVDKIGQWRHVESYKGIS